MPTTPPRSERASDKRRALGHHPIAAQRERNAHLREQAESIARAQPLDVPVPVPVGVVPANTRETAPLPLRTRRVFLDRLAERIRATYAEPDTGATPADVATLDPAPSTQHATASILGRSCATCRGECCTAGGDHAFLREDSLARVRSTHPAHNEQSLIATYAAHLPARHYRGSCVYHTTVGCALPRTLRANICNRYLCGGLTQLKRALESSESEMAFVAAADSVHLRRMARIDANGTRGIPLR